MQKKRGQSRHAFSAGGSVLAFRVPSDKWTLADLDCLAIGAAPGRRAAHLGENPNGIMYAFSTRKRLPFAISAERSFAQKWVEM